MKNLLENPDDIKKWSYALARDWIIENLVPIGVFSSRKFIAYRKRGGYIPKNFPKDPRDCFVRKETWKGWDHFLDKENVKQTKYLSYQIAASVCKRSGIRNYTDFNNWKERPDNIPRRPNREYGEQWKGWHRFLGTYYSKKSFLRNCKLKEADVMIIKHQLQIGTTKTNIAKFFDISITQITRIERGENWGKVKLRERFEKI